MKERQSMLWVNRGEDIVVIDTKLEMIDLICDMSHLTILFELEKYGNNKDQYDYVWSVIKQRIDDGDVSVTPTFFKNLITDKRVKRIDTKIRIFNEFLDDVITKVTLSTTETVIVS